MSKYILFLITGGIFTLANLSMASADDFRLRPRGYRTVELLCESHSKKFRSCPVGGEILDIQLLQQRSDRRCVEGVSFGADNNLLWVDRGCRGVFEVTYRPRRTYGRQYNVTCESKKYRYETCAVNGDITDAYVIDQKSDADCDYGISWGIRRNYLWVDKGCRATFRVVAE